MTCYMCVKVPVANLRKTPKEAMPLLVRDEMQESQLLFNEVVAIREERGDWLAVDAVEQQKLVDGTWQGYPGWMRRKDLAPADGPAPYNGVVKAPFTTARILPAAKAAAVFPLGLGTRLSFTDEAKGFLGFAMEGGKPAWVAKDAIASMPPKGGVKPAEVVRLARLFLGAVYLWGGRSMPMPWAVGPVMGIDCSALVSLAFRAAGIDLPRDAHDQCKAASSIEAASLKAADLIFLASAGVDDTVRHVMVHLGGERLIEAAETGDMVRISTFRERLGVSLKEIAKGHGTGPERKIYFGRIL